MSSKFINIDQGKAGLILKNSIKGGLIDTAGLMFSDEEQPSNYGFLWTDPAIFDEEARKKFLELSESERVNFVISLLEKFYADNIEYANFMQVQIHKDPMLLLDFFKNVKLDHFEKCNIADNGRFEKMQEQIKEAENEIKENPINYDDIKLTDIWPILRIRNPFNESELAALYYIQHKKQIIDNQNKKREERRRSKQIAADQNAIMELKGGNYSIFSKKELWAAFAPGNIVKMGSLDKSFINEETGEIDKPYFAPGELLDIKATDISYNAYILLNSIFENSIDNVREEWIKSGQITFYVDGIAKAFTDDVRGLIKEVKEEAETNITSVGRKTAGVIYFENLFEPLIGLVGKMPNGSRYSVFNYIGYDAEADTMTVSSPYIYQLWKYTQQDYFIRKSHKELALSDNKKPKQDDLRPLEINNTLKGKAITADPITLEIASYITNVLLNAGTGSGKVKNTEILYTSIIKKCPGLKERLDNIKNNTEKENEAGKKINKTALYNGQLKKIASAFDLIQDPEKCRINELCEFINISPAKRDPKTNKFILYPPTKSTIKGKIIITWKGIKDN